ncbi:NUDIX domain-containing protein [Tsukamurella sp. 8F]|uniref:NUDIX hydrolase n=1 Tax=unclassified Tsukamurella TaxID=2633480 RepID=UPI0023B997FD|nr:MULTISPECIES: NUDIX domain-containing protein [unclassified Tsukamurella]MDF0531380.1 NUDIX domain-containing protein [Tsukamurella sp. 8J]MDF0585314.1 NUDIX domain-containing protein [Tsukamurella sp. 8F]
MISLTATTVIVAGLILLILVAVAVTAYQTAHRLDRLHVRTDLSWQALESALARRAAVARTVAVSLPADKAERLRGFADRAEAAERPQREVRENRLSAALSTLEAESLPSALVAELADADARVMIARRFHNDAVRDTRALRGRRFVRWFHLGGTAPMPAYFEIVDRGGAVETPVIEGRPRVSARVLLFDPEGAVLLIRGHDPQVPGSPGFWFSVGGGVDEGEELVDAAVREVYEETGLRLDRALLRGPVFRRQAVFTFAGQRFDSVEFFFVCQVARFTPAPVRLGEMEAQVVDELRWCTGAELNALAAERPVFPVELSARLAQAHAAVHSVGPLVAVDIQ